MMMKGFLLFVGGLLLGALLGAASLWYFLGDLERWHAAMHERMPVQHEPAQVAPDSSHGAGDDNSAAKPITDAPLAPLAPGAEPVSPVRELSLTMPVVGVAASQLRDVYEDARSGGRIHQAIDIMAPTGSLVVAVEDGTIAKLFESKLGGLTVYQFGPHREIAYYYAHLDRYAAGLADGQPIKRGDLIGYVGSSGNATTPHLHFAIFRLGPEKRWWEGTAVNPYPYLGPQSTGEPSPG